MVPFAGFSMPLSYSSDGGQIASHNHVRTQAGLFDVSHMVQSFFRGPSATAFLSSLVPSSLESLPEWHSTLSVLLNEEGGIIDDTILTKHSEGEWYVVTNAGRREEDLAWFGKKLEEWNAKEGKEQRGKVVMEVLEGWGLIALQGPKAVEVLQQHTSHDLSTLYFGQSAYMDVKGVNCHVARGGYTGEDGFEISIPPANTVDITALLAATEPVQLTGLGPRDSLRLEAGMCLYGHDLDESVSPVEAGLSWVIGKDRRAAADFLGSSRILKELASGPARRRVGFLITGAPAREGAEIYARGGKEVIGKITSGIPSPTVGGNIGMGYIQNGFHKKGTEVSIMVRKKLRDAVVKAMPFVEAKYYRKP
ncbi:hypothetical protein BDY24DRAFT_352301 [Mrakia frigida]|uniref:glycine decarboxylase subunit T n=1 Tax=Mrakia frigida TaxID=29902 RepID=UPI003FCBFB22